MQKMTKKDRQRWLAEPLRAFLYYELAKRLESIGYRIRRDLMEETREGLLEIDGVGEGTVETIIAGIKKPPTPLILTEEQVEHGDPEWLDELLVEILPARHAAILDNAGFIRRRDLVGESLASICEIDNIQHQSAETIAKAIAADKVVDSDPDGLKVEHELRALDIQASNEQPDRKRVGSMKTQSEASEAIGVTYTRTRTNGGYRRRDRLDFLRGRAGCNR